MNLISALHPSAILVKRKLRFTISSKLPSTSISHYVRGPREVACIEVNLRLPQAADFLDRNERQVDNNPPHARVFEIYRLELFSLFTRIWI